MPPRRRPRVDAPVSESTSDLQLTDLTHDPENARAHTPRNLDTIVSSINEVGAARSVVIDERGVILAGNATVDAAQRAGITRVRVIDTDGRTIVAVRRSGLTAREKRRLALADNRAAELAEWDVDVLRGFAADGDLDGMWTPEEQAKFAADFAPVGEDEQGSLGTVEPRLCPHCGRAIE